MVFDDPKPTRLNGLVLLLVEQQELNWSVVQLAFQFKVKRDEVKQG